MKSLLTYTLIYIRRRFFMEQVAKLFANGRSQAVRLPAVFRFDAKEVYIRQDAETHDVILSRRPSTWDGFFAVLHDVCAVPADFLTADERGQGHAAQERDPLEGVGR
jgi:antitoxin VapB